jgi:hypothetical protein
MTGIAASRDNYVTYEAEKLSVLVHDDDREVPGVEIKK